VPDYEKNQQPVLWSRKQEEDTGWEGRGGRWPHGKTPLTGRSWRKKERGGEKKKRTLQCADGERGLRTSKGKRKRPKTGVLRDFGSVKGKTRIGRGQGFWTTQRGRKGKTTSRTDGVATKLKPTLHGVWGHGEKKKTPIKRGLDNHNRGV